MNLDRRSTAVVTIKRQVVRSDVRNHGANTDAGVEGLRGVCVSPPLILCQLVVSIMCSSLVKFKQEAFELGAKL